MSRAVDSIAIGYLQRAEKNPARTGDVYREAARTFAGFAADPRNAGLVPVLLGWAGRFSDAVRRPATVIDFGDILAERAEAYKQVGSPLDDFSEIAREAEIHEERTPGLPRLSITPKSVNLWTRLGDRATVKWEPTEAEISAGTRRQNTVILWQGDPEESQAVTIDSAVIDQPQEANAVGGPRPYQVLTYGSHGAVADVKMDVGQRVTVPASYVSLLVSLNPPRTDFTKGQVTVAASLGFFAAPSVAPVIYTDYVDDIDDGSTSGLILRPVKAMYIQPIQSTLEGGSARITFYALDGGVPRYVVQYINSAQNVPIPLSADVAFITITNTSGGGASSYRIPWQLSL